MKKIFESKRKKNEIKAECGF